MRTHDRLAELEPGCSPAQAMELFDSCEPLSWRQMLGQWKGSGLPTGHPMDGLLEATGWYGKNFAGMDEVDPLVFRDRRGRLVRVNPALMPMGAPRQLFDLTTREPVSRIVRPIVSSLRTFSPAARLRQVEYRGQVTATMIYDALPICDHFRAVDEDTVVGAMDYRKSPQPFMFVLRRVTGSQREEIT
jgi:hypothetical protein